jgi:hypothetical protein
MIYESERSPHLYSDNVRLGPHVRLHVYNPLGDGVVVAATTLSSSDVVLKLLKTRLPTVDPFKT